MWLGFVASSTGGGVGAGLYGLPAILLFYAPLLRYGLLAMVASMFALHLYVFYALTPDLTAWYATNWMIGCAVLVALAVYGFRLSLAGQSLARGDLLER